MYSCTHCSPLLVHVLLQRLGLHGLAPAHAARFERSDGHVHHTTTTAWQGLVPPICISLAGAEATWRRHMPVCPPMPWPPTPLPILPHPAPSPPHPRPIPAPHDWAHVLLLYHYGTAQPRQAQPSKALRCLGMACNRDKRSCHNHSARRRPCGACPSLRRWCRCRPARRCREGRTCI